MTHTVTVSRDGLVHSTHEVDTDNVSSESFWSFLNNLLDNGYTVELNDVQAFEREAN